MVNTEKISVPPKSQEGPLIPQEPQHSQEEQHGGVCPGGSTEEATVKRREQGIGKGQKGKGSGVSCSQENTKLKGGILRWMKKTTSPTGIKVIEYSKVLRFYATVVQGDPRLAELLAQNLSLKLIPDKLLRDSELSAFLKDSQHTLFHPEYSPNLTRLSKAMSRGFSGCVYFQAKLSPETGEENLVLILLRTDGEEPLLGLIPKNQAGFKRRLLRLLQHQKDIDAYEEKHESAIESTSTGNIDELIRGECISENSRKVTANAHLIENVLAPTSSIISPGPTNVQSSPVSFPVTTDAQACGVSVPRNVDSQMSNAYCLENKYTQNNRATQNSPQKRKRSTWKRLARRKLLAMARNATMLSSTPNLDTDTISQPAAQKNNSWPVNTSTTTQGSANLSSKCNSTGYDLNSFRNSESHYNVSPHRKPDSGKDNVSPSRKSDSRKEKSSSSRKSDSRKEKSSSSSKSDSRKEKRSSSRNSDSRKESSSSKKSDSSQKEKSSSSRNSDLQKEKSSSFGKSDSRIEKSIASKKSEYQKEKSSSSRKSDSQIEKPSSLSYSDSREGSSCSPRIPNSRERSLSSSQKYIINSTGKLDADKDKSSSSRKLDSDVKESPSSGKSDTSNYVTCSSQNSHAHKYQTNSSTTKSGSPIESALSSRKADPKHGKDLLGKGSHKDLPLDSSHVSNSADKSKIRKMSKVPVPEKSNVAVDIHERRTSKNKIHAQSDWERDESPREEAVVETDIHERRTPKRKPHAQSDWERDESPREEAVVETDIHEQRTPKRQPRRSSY